ncbi:hypothetical protein QQ045_001526 [Rhodiola kirilowii]
MACHHFQHHLTAFSVVPPAEAFDHIHATISDADNDHLTAQPTPEEIWEVNRTMNSSSAPGPDGFTGHFYKHCWSIIKGDLYKVVHVFFSGMQLPSSITATHLVLLPKKPNASKIEQLRPISLCNFVHKILSGLLNKRLRRILPMIISPEQAGFMPDRSSMESITLAHELTCHINNGRAGGNVIMKLDMSKAYDRVSWLFLLRMMRALGFNA